MPIPIGGYNPADLDETEEAEALMPCAKAIAQALLNMDAPGSKALLAPYRKAAFWFALGVNPFVRVGDILLSGVRHILSQQESWNPEVEALFLSPSEPAATADELQLFDRLIALVPDFDNILHELLVDAPQVFPLSKYLTEKAQSQHQSDSSDLKYAILQYLPDCPPQDKEAVQVYFALSLADQWKTEISGFNLSVLYEQILNLFEDPDDPWAKETLEWWNRKVGIYHEPKLVTISGSETEPETNEDPLEVIKVQCHHRHEMESQNSHHGTPHQSNGHPKDGDNDSQPNDVGSCLNNLNIDENECSSHNQHETDDADEC
ncbi:hypothetical protein AX14_006190 [Amanita brunnescens Koide BX004]|nr:hypothetical protein AX14_006190 [Amanita brunnescens Koide BX004]